MTEKKKKSLAKAFEQSVKVANWITDSDAAVVHYGMELATQLDALVDAVEVDKFTVLAPKYLAVLQQLHLTPETRTQGKQHDDTSGQDYSNAFIRLIDPKVARPAGQGQKRRASGSATS